MYIQKKCKQVKYTFKLLNVINYFKCYEILL